MSTDQVRVMAKSDNPILGSTEHSDAAHTLPVIHDNWYVSLGKRVWAIAPLLAMTFSTLNQLFAVAKSLAAQSNRDNDYDDTVEVTSNGLQSSFQCEYGDAQTVVVSVYDMCMDMGMACRLWC